MLGYIDPGTTQSVFSALAPVLAVLVAVAMALLWPLRWLWAHTLGRLRRRSGDDALPALGQDPARYVWLRRLVVVTALLAGALMARSWLLSGGNAMPANTEADTARLPGGHEARFDRVIVIGMDGLDPRIAGDMMDAGELPNFTRLRKDGTCVRMRSSNPSQSPVAWSSAATGCNPGRHGLFDFIRRDPRTYLPELAVLRGGSSFRRSGMYKPVRRGPAFWEVTSRLGVPTSVIRWPVTFPPEQVNGRFLSGLGVPDVCGGLGRYSFYTSRAVAKDDPAPECVTHVEIRDGHVQTALYGPMVATLAGRKHLELPLSIERADGGVRITLGGQAPFVLRVGEWSDWVAVRFGGRLSRVPAMVKFYLVSAEPDLALYVSPIEIDPRKPALPISEPATYATQLAEEIGPYHTLGIPEDTKAVTEGRFGDEPFLQECDAIMREREAMLDRELAAFSHTTRGVLAFVFDTSDRIQHMYWRTRDPKHPAYDAAHAKRYANVIPDHYKRLDTALGRVLAVADAKTLVIVLSDHGFTTFRRSVHLNRWLIEAGYLKLKDGKAEGGGLLRDVDWSATRAYAVGFAGIYVNVAGREGRGIVAPGEPQRALAREIARNLKNFRDPKTGAEVVRAAYLSGDLYSGPMAAEAPDIIVGYAEGHRGSWQTAVGAAPVTQVEDNAKPWSGTHLCDPSIVPAILCSNAKLSAADARIIDIAPTVLDALGLPVPQEMDGRSLLR